MKPIYMSANYEQVDAIKTLLGDNGIATTLQAKEDANNPLAPKGIIWFELWLKRQDDEDSAETLIEKFEFNELKNSLSVTWQAMHAPLQENRKDKTEGVPITFTQVKQRKYNAYESWLPINNQKVFHRLAATLGFSEEEILSEEFNRLRRPWNPDRLKSQVQALQQVCKSRISAKALSNS